MERDVDNSSPSGAEDSNEWICIVRLPSLNRRYWWTTVTFQLLLMAHGLSGLGQQRLACHPVLFLRLVCEKGTG